jgi:hypothetical protein
MVFSSNCTDGQLHKGSNLQPREGSLLRVSCSKASGDVAKLKARRTIVLPVFESAQARQALELIATDGADAT